ncbi:MAG TPA: preprotein translocase subunit YajC [Myxococcota bacterium]|nr:preprotein translocase subunit YajC [Myxococcota bacterium]
MNLLPLAIPLQAAAPEQSPLGMFVPMIAIFLIFYFLFIRPQQKKQREQETLLKAIDKGDDVVTAGGLHGKVVGTTDDVLTLEIAALKGERVRVKVSRAKIDSVQKAKKGEKEEEA